MSKPSTFVKTFVCDYVEDMDRAINTFAKKHGLDIKLISIEHKFAIYATVVFERSCKDA